MRRLFDLLNNSPTRFIPYNWHIPHFNWRMDVTIVTHFGTNLLVWHKNKWSNKSIHYIVCAQTALITSHTIIYMYTEIISKLHQDNDNLTFSDNYTYFETWYRGGLLFVTHNLCWKPICGVSDISYLWTNRQCFASADQRFERAAGTNRARHNFVGTVILINIKWNLIVLLH